MRLAVIKKQNKTLNQSMHLGVVVKYPWIFMQFGLCIIQNVLFRDLTKINKKNQQETRNKGG